MRVRRRGRFCGLPRRCLSGVYAKLSRRQAKNQPAFMGVDEGKAQNVAQKGAVGGGVCAVDQHVCTKKHSTSLAKKLRCAFAIIFPAMKSIRLYNWEDKLKRRVIREVKVLTTTRMNRNGVQRIYIWSDGEDEPNYMLYPKDGTAYPEYDERMQRQRNSKVFRYEED